MSSDFESKSKSKESDKRTQALSSCEQIRAMSPQVHEVYNVEIVENDEKNNNEDHDDRSESEQIMVPYGKCLSANDVWKLPLGLINTREVCPNNLGSSSFRSVQVEFESHKQMDFMVQSYIRHKIRTHRSDTPVDRRGTAAINIARLAEYRRDGR